VSDLSAVAAQITGSGVCPRAGRGHAVYMADSAHDVRVSDDSTEAQTDESGTPEQATVTVARMLANPRRVRRN
jgi:hypothetical protein